MTAAVVDTNVFILAVVRVLPEAVPAAEVLRVTDEIWVPGSLFAECANVMRNHVRRGDFTTAEAIDLLEVIPPLVTQIGPVPSLWRRALELSEAEDHSPFDTLFVALAEREGLRVVTFDRKLANKFPAYCLDPAAFLAAP